MHSWLAQRTAAFDSSGIRKAFDRAATISDPINLSIGQPDFPVPDVIKEAAIEAIRGDKNGYSVTQGIAPLLDRLTDQIRGEYVHSDRRVAVTSGTSGALNLAMMALVNPGDEVIIFDPYFVMYPALTRMVGGVPVLIDTYPDFHLDPQKLEDAITGRTKLILLNSPGNPTGIQAGEQEVRAVAEIAARRNIALVSDEIYSAFCYERPLISPAKFNPDTIVIDGFSKTYAVTGWRVGYVHGPAEVVEAMTKLQQYTFVCAPHPFQWAALAAPDVDMQPQIDLYRQRRDMLLAGIGDAYEVEKPDGAFYIFPRAPWGTGTEFVDACLDEKLLVIPGGIFSRQDTHFRISYAASEETISRGIEVLRRLARKD